MMPGASQPKEGQFHKNDGSSIEPFLRSGAIALLDADWLMQRASSRRKNEPLERRQDLPPEAFLSIDDLIAETEKTASEIPIFMLSYMWLNPIHPDPHCKTLELVARTVSQFMREDLKIRWGIFWDYASLYQHDPFTGKRRTKKEDELFREGLGGLSVLYSHKCTTVLKVTAYPTGYSLTSYTEEAVEMKAQQGIEKNHGGNPYDQRGWPFVESSWSSMIKDSGMVYDLGKLPYGVDDERFDIMDLFDESRKSRRAPLTPERFNEEIDKRTFSNGKDDRPKVKELYNESVIASFGEIEKLDYYRLDWDDDEGMHLMEVLGGGYAPCLKVLDLSYNLLGVAAGFSLRDVIGSGALPRLTTLYLSWNYQIGDVGLKALAPQFFRLEKVVLDHIGMTEDGCESLRDGVVHCKNAGVEVRLESLDLGFNKIGDAGIVSLADMVGQISSTLKKLTLDGNPISEEAHGALHDTCTACDVQLI